MSSNINIIWDWNGTLLNDLTLSVSTINTLLAKRKLPLLNITSYKNIFSFPVKDYYSAIGFDFVKEDFNVPAKEFINLYQKGINNCTLHSSATEVLSFFKKKGAQQYILSAMEQSMLENTLQKNGISHFFEGIAGLDNYYAVSKIDKGKQLINKYKIKIKNTWIIGDTIHDYEVSQALQTNCILISNGHQSETRLTKTTAPVISDLKELISTQLFANN